MRPGAAGDLETGGGRGLGPSSGARSAGVGRLDPGVQGSDCGLDAGSGGREPLQPLVSKSWGCPWSPPPLRPRPPCRPTTPSALCSSRGKGPGGAGSGWEPPGPWELYRPTHRIVGKRGYVFPRVWVPVFLCACASTRVRAHVCVCLLLLGQPVNTAGTIWSP